MIRYLAALLRILGTCLAAAGIAFFFLEVSIRGWLCERITCVAPATFHLLECLIIPRAEVLYESPLVKPDEMLGYSLRPGQHTITIRKGSSRRAFTVSVDDDGLRRTTPGSSRHYHLPQIWIHGCSFTWGYLLNDGDTFPWILQARFPSLWIRNFGGNGYGTIHAFLQLKQAIDSKRPTPLVSVISYNSFHIERNVASAKTLAAFKANREHFSWLRYPSARLGGSGQLTIDMTPVFSDSPRSLPEPTSQELLRIELAILREIDKLTKAHHIIPVMAVQSGDRQDPVITYAHDDLGWEVAWIDPSNHSPNDVRRFRLWPLDDHPNEAAHTRYAEGLVPMITRLVRDEAVVKTTHNILFLVNPHDGPQQRILSISNPSNAKIHTIAKPSPDSSSWLTISPPTAQLLPNQRADLRVTVYPTGSQFTQQKTYIELSNGSGETVRIPVTVSLLQQDKK
jgi:hypothetical protein